MDLFGNPSQNFGESRERVACEGSGDAVSELAALVEAMAARKCSAGQIANAVRDFARQAALNRATVAGGAGAPQAAGLVWIALDSPEWRAWAAVWRAAKGKNPPLDARGGWRFPARWPPSVEDRA